MAEEKKKHSWVITDNRTEYFGGGFSSAGSREEAFKAANYFIGSRISSGYPTKRPLVIFVQEKNKKGDKNLREWHITLEIKQGPWKGAKK